MRQQLFVGLALRTARDHWYDADKRPEEYFRAAAHLYVEDAKSASVDRSAAVPDIKVVTDLLTADALLIERENFGPVVNWTSDNRMTLPFDVKAPTIGPGGYVTLWPRFPESPSLMLRSDDRSRQAVASRRQVRRRLPKRNCTSRRNKPRPTAMSGWRCSAIFGASG